MKILINTPDINKSGGVASHYLGLKEHWQAEVSYNFIGGRRSVPGPLILIFDYIFFFIRLLFIRYDVVLLNPSLGSTALRRDALFLKISKLFKLKTIVFLHGWDDNFACKIDLNPSVFLRKFGSADSFIVLASKFQNKLIYWGIHCPIHISTTKVEDKLLYGFDIKYKVYNNSILFLARIEREKGIFVAIDAFSIVQRKFKNVTLNIVGDGSVFDEAFNYVKENGILNVSFWGDVREDKLSSAFLESSIYILPTSHGEGMPTSVLEAMAFGLPVISRPVGGMVDFFEQERMGYLIESLNPEDYASILIDLLNSPLKIKDMGAYNYDYAHNTFMASTVCYKLETILKL